MAVEIPVVVDIEGAFRDAAKRVPAAMEPLKKTIESLTSDLSVFRELLSEVPVNSDEFRTIAKEIQAISQALEVADDLFKKFSTNDGSIKQMSATLASLERRWSEMGAKQKFTKNGELTADAKALRAEYEKVTAELQKQGKTLSQMAQEERNAAAEAKRRADAEAKERERINAANKMKVQQRRDENLILQMEGKTIQVLQQQQRILTERIAKTRIGSEEYKRMQQKLAEVNIELQKATGNVNAMTNGIQRQSRVMQGLTTMASMYVSVFGALRLVKQIRDVTGELEFQRISLGRLLQDVERGNYLFERIKEAAIESPFRIKDLVTYTKQLAAYRIEQESLFDTTKRLADISAGLGVDMNRLILAYGQVRAASVLRGQELRQFTEAGIPLVELLAEKFTDLNGEMVSTGEVFKKISDRAVPFSMIADIFEDLTEKGGMFYQMQEEQAKTLKGRWEKLKDAYDVALQSIGDTKTFQRQNDVVIGALRLVADNLRIITKVVDAAVLSWAAYNAAMLIAGKRTRAVATAEQEAAIQESLRTKSVNKLFVSLKAEAWAEKQLELATRQATLGTNGLTRAIGRLRIAMITNPWGIALAAVSGIALAIGRYKDATNDAAEATHTLNRAVDDMHSFNKHHERTAGLIEKYKELSEVEERNSAQNETLARTTKKLADEFPGLRERLNDNNISLKERLKLVEDLNTAEAERLANTIKEKEQTLEASKTKLSYARGEQEAADQARKDIEAYYNELERKLNELRGQGKEGRGFFGRFFLGDNEYDYYYRQIVLQRKALDEAEEAANKAGDAVRSLEEGIESLEKEIGNSNNEVEDAEKEWEEWQRQINKIQKERLKFGESPLFSKEDITSLKSVYDLSGKLKKKTDELTVSIAGMKVLYKSMGDGEAKESLGKTIAKEEKWLEIANAIKTALDLSWKTSKKGTDTRLSDLKKDISEITNAYKKFIELRKYMSEERAFDEMNVLFPQLKGWKPTLENTIERIRGLMSGYKGPKDKVFFEMQRAIDTEISNLKFDDLKKKTDDELERISNEIKRSETAKNFYKNILDLTGDEDLATSLTVSVYGGIGEDFKDRLQKELYSAIRGLDASQLSDELKNEMFGAIATMDSAYMRENIKDLPDNVRKMFEKALDEYDEYNAKVMKGYVELLMKYDDVKHQEIDIENEYRHAIEAIDEGLAVEKKGILENEVKENQEAATKMAEDRAAAAKKIAGLDKELKLSRLKKEYKLFFSSVGLMSEEAARKVVKEQKEILLKQFLIDGNFTKYRKEIKALDEQLEKYTKNQGLLASYLSGGIDAATSKLSEFSDRLSALSGSIFDKDGMLDISEESITFINKLGKIFGGSMFGVSGRKNVWDKILDEYKDNPEKIKDALADAAEEIKSKAQDFQQAMFWVDFWVGLGGGAISALGEIASYNKKVTDEFTDEWNTVARVVLDVMSFGAADTWATDNQMDRLLALNEKALSGYQKFKSGDILGSLVDNYIGWSEVFGKSTKAIDREIEKQSKTIERLDYQYGRLEKSMQKAFGSDYISDYNKQLDVLYAKQAAYEEQARLEESKPKKKRDVEKVEEYNKQAEAVADQIADMQHQLSEFFTGTDLTSAAKDFATAWIDAYKEFGSTTDAMKEKFNDMIQEMVTNSLAARIMQEILQPLFDDIDKMSKDGELSGKEIAAIAAATPKYIEDMNNAMSVLMAGLTAEGYNFRQQVGQYTGIKRNIANATEESINGLTQAMNVNNFYMSHIPGLAANVAQILAIMTGGTAENPATGASYQLNSDLVLQYMSALPTIDQNISELLRTVKSVISDKNSASNINVVAVRA